MFAWNMLGISYDEYISTGIFDIYFTCFGLLMLFMLLSWIPFYRSCKTEKFNSWTSSKIFTYPATLIGQALIIYFFSFAVGIVLCVLFSVLMLLLVNFQEIPNCCKEAQKGRTALRNDIGEIEKEKFSQMTQIQQEEFLSHIPPLEKMRIHVLPFSLICGILPIAFSSIYFFVIL